MAVRSKIEDNECLVLDELALPEAKTKQVRLLLKALKLDATTCLLGVTGYDRNLVLAVRNMAEAKVLPVGEFNAYTVLRQKRLVLTKDALEELRQGPPRGVKIEKAPVTHPRKKVRGAKAKAALKAAAKPQAKKK